MYERCLNEAEHALGSQKDALVPVKKLWSTVSRQGKTLGFEVPMLADFTALLEGDRRFDLIPSAEEDALPEDFEGNAEEIGEMEKLGVSPEDQVRLRRSIPRVENEADEEITSIHRVKASRPAKKNSPPEKKKIVRPASPKKRQTASTRGRTVKRASVKKAAPTSTRRSSVRRGRKK